MNKEISMRLQQFLFVTVASFIFLLSVYGRKLQELLTSIIDSYMIAGAVFTVLLLALVYLLYHRKSNAIPLWAMCMSLCILISMAFAVYYKFLVPIEAVHLLVFSLFGWLAATVLGPLKALLTVFLISTGDEILQHYLPDRVGDIHDVVINLLSGVAGVVLRSRL